MIDPITKHILEQDSNDKYSRAFDRTFEEINLSEYDSLGMVDAEHIGAIALAAFVGRMAYKLYKDKISNIGKQCSQYKHGSSERYKCEAAAKKKAMQAQIGALKAGMSKCTKSKDVDKCKQAINDKIIKLQTKIQSM